MQNLTNEHNPPPPPPRVRTCNGCFETFRVGLHRRHVRNDCGSMISVEQLRAAIQAVANRTGDDSITLKDLEKTIERIAATRASAINAGLPASEDMEVVAEGRRTTLLAHRREAFHRIERRIGRRADRGIGSASQVDRDVESVAADVSIMHI